MVNLDKEENIHLNTHFFWKTFPTKTTKSYTNKINLYSNMLARFISTCNLSFPNFLVLQYLKNSSLSLSSSSVVIYCKVFSILGMITAKKKRHNYMETVNDKPSQIPTLEC